MMRTVIGKRIVRYKQTSSTNDRARDAAEHGEPEGLVITAEEQTAGRGRLGRAWLAPAGSSIQLSILLRPPLAAAEAWQLVPLGALAVAWTLRRRLNLDPAFKWPNDVLLNGKKCAGILVETSIEGDRVEYALLGIGLNVNFSMRDFPELLPFATTLLDELGTRVEVEPLETALVEELDRGYGRLRSGESLVEEWREGLTTVGRRVLVSTPEGVEEGMAEGVGADGALLLRRGDELLRFYAGDVTLVRQVPAGSGA